MSISPVGNVASYVAPTQARATAQARPVAPTAVGGGDSDGDNDGSKGGTVDVRA